MSYTSMRNLALALLLSLVGGIASAQNPINPLTQVKWEKLTGHGAPDPAACTKLGLPYTDLDGPHYYTCVVLLTTWFQIDGGGGGGSCGPQTDTSNTDCGTGNQDGLVSTPPAEVSTFGVDNVTGGNNSTDIVAIGELNYTGDNHVDHDVIAVGNANATVGGQYMNDTVLIGDHNVFDTACRSTDFIAIGHENLPSCPAPPGFSFNDVVLIGARNSDNRVSSGYSSPNYGSVVAIGNDNDRMNQNTLAVGSHTEIVAIGDTNVRTFKSCDDCIGIGDFSLQAQNLDVSATGMVGIGQVALEGVTDGSFSDIAIGVAAGGVPLGSSAGPITESISIGDSAGDNSASDENIAIGDSPMYGGVGLPGNTGANNNAIGFEALGTNTTGTENVAIGTNAGCVSCSFVSNGNGNRTGSHNVWIGDEAGQSVAGTTQIDDSVAIGFNSQNTKSHQVILGGPTVVETLFRGYMLPSTLYSAAGMALPSCVSGLNGAEAVVSDATAPTYHGAYTSGGTVTSRVICNGATTTWLTD